MHTLPARENITISDKPQNIKNPQKRTKRQYILMLKAIRKGYSKLKAEDKYLYEILVEYDYADETTGLCKGYVFPDPKKTLTSDCNTSYRTICRQLERLERAKLIKRVPRQNRGPLIILLDIDTAKLSTYQNERRMPKMAIAYKGNKENRRTNNKQLQSSKTLEYYEARFDDVVTRLISLGYAPTQAVNDFVEFGRDELQHQIENLYAYLRHGKVFGSYARWLNWAIRTRHRVNLAELTPAQLECSPDCDNQQAGEWVAVESADPYEANTLFWRPKESTETPTTAIDADPVDPRPFHSSSHEARELVRPTAAAECEPGLVPFAIPIPIPQTHGIDNWIDTERFSHPNAATSSPPLSLRFPDHTRTTSLLTLRLWSGNSDEWLVE